MIASLNTPLVKVMADFNERLEEAQDVITYLARHNGVEHKFYKQIVDYYTAKIAYDKFSLRDDLTVLSYPPTEADYIFYNLPTWQVKLVLTYHEFKQRRRMKG